MHLKYSVSHHSTEGRDTNFHFTGTLQGQLNDINKMPSFATQCAFPVADQ